MDEALLRPFVFHKYEYGNMVTGLFSDGTWYISLKEDGTPNGKVGQIDYEGTEGMTSVENPLFIFPRVFRSGRMAGKGYARCR